MRLLLASVVLLWLSAVASAEETVEVQLQQGAIVGSRSEAKGGRTFYGFLGIPFAQPPIGALRFKDPVAAGAWEGVRNGTVASPLCPQPDAPSDWTQEDCLYLSVYTPQPNRTDLPVMVWLPQGGFINDVTPMFQPEFLLARDVVLVVLQHRLGVLGFLSTEDSELPGNLGLKDQALALRWVQDNIRDLGGDPDKVTIFGQNAGGAAVHYHMLSPMSSGLFQRAIMQSGAALCPWALREDHRQVAFSFGRMVSCPGERGDAANSTALVDCLREVPVKQLMAVQPYIMPSPYVLTPRVDGEFLPDHPATLVREGRYNRVDVLSGVTRDEGALNARAFVEDGVVDSMIQNFSLLGPPALGFEAWDDDPEYLARLAFHRYLGPMEFDLTKIDPLVKLLGDSFYSMCNVETIEHHARDAAFGYRVFAYELQHRGEHAFSDLFRGPSPAWNLAYVGDSDDLQYLFSFDKFNISLSKDEDLFVSRIMVDLWTNFAATGNPTPDLSLGFKWTPTSASSLSYLGLTSAPAMKVYDRDQDIEFWRNLPRKMNKLLYPDRFSKESCTRPNDTVAVDGAAHLRLSPARPSLSLAKRTSTRLTLETNAGGSRVTSPLGSRQAVYPCIPPDINKRQRPALHGTCSPSGERKWREIEEATKQPDGMAADDATRNHVRIEAGPKGSQMKFKSVSPWLSCVEVFRMRSWVVVMLIVATSWVAQGRTPDPEGPTDDPADAQDAVTPDGAATDAPEGSVEVVLQQGRIRTVGRSAFQERQKVYAFKGIPFARPPVGDLRLRKTKTKEKHKKKGTRETTKNSGTSMARPFFVAGHEDCLFLSVYTPRPSQTADLPVMVWFHGGGFKSGSGAPFPRLADEGAVVVVAVQYRLGLLGFLSTEDAVLPGNLGLKDQAMALAWVKENIRDLGGDPHKVTIFGESAGGASVHFHILSPMSKGFFARAIMQSGSALCPWALASNHAKMAIEVLQKLNCSDASFPPLDSQGLLTCLQETPVHFLLELPSAELRISEFAPRVDGAFLPAPPVTLLKEGRFNAVDILSGTTQHEGASFVNYFFSRPEFPRYVNDYFTTAAPEMLFLEDGDSPAYLARRIFFHFVGGLRASRDDEEALVEMFGQRFNVACQDETALLHARTSPYKVFAYEFRHRPSGRRLYVGHLDDLPFLFEGVAPPLSRPQDLFVSRLLLALWTNFAKTGNPTPDLSLGFRWAPMSSGCLSFLAITPTPTMQHDTRQEVRAFWNHLPLPQNRLLYPAHFAPNVSPMPCPPTR
ncbi:uncharacterized protein LOC125039021 [Penaeus chinensis]|uniref:uncharacterized protein LOC125039021 n=1 Tax=Penaeus chinensis TaxID=139456 RepID=UPI001FB6BBE5|nr:uncharacterized protein LOC125039021 [Penaeus chinensis]